MGNGCPALIEVLATVPDYRRPQGTRHPLRAILGLAVAATLCGYRSYAAMAQWGRLYGADLAGALGFTRPETPCVGTFHAVFRPPGSRGVRSGPDPLGGAVPGRSSPR